MATNYKLVYFNFSGRAEVSLWLLKLGGVNFENITINRQDWEINKNTDKYIKDTPFGQVPYLETSDGLKLCQSKTIERYLARKFDYAGKTAEENAKADMIVDCVMDIAETLVNATRKCKTDAEKEIRVKEFKEKLPIWLKYLSGFLEKNQKIGGKGFVGKDYTWADLVFLSIVGWHERFLNTKIDIPYENLNNLIVNVKTFLGI